MGRVNAARILDWMDKHIDGCEDPRIRHRSEVYK